jgi:DNA repair protein RadA/Sms
MVLAVLEAHCGVKLSGYDVYFNVAGGLRINEPPPIWPPPPLSMSSLANAPLPVDAVYFGEISLSGAVRPVAQTSRDSRKPPPGFGRAVLPETARSDAVGDAGLVLNTVGSLTSLVADIAARGRKATAPGKSAPEGRSSPITRAHGVTRVWADAI